MSAAGLRGFPNMTKKHMLIMVLCCLAPVVGYAAMSMLGVRLNAILFTGMVLLCPILHLIVVLSIKSYAHNDQRSRAEGQLRRGDKGKGPDCCGGTTESE